MLDDDEYFGFERDIFYMDETVSINEETVERNDRFFKLQG